MFKSDKQNEICFRLRSKEKNGPKLRKKMECYYTSLPTFIKEFNFFILPKRSLHDLKHDVMQTMHISRTVLQGGLPI